MWDSGIVILAAGSSTRFGSDKLLYECNGLPLAYYIMHTVKKTGLPSVVIYQDEGVANIAMELGLRTIENKEAKHGQSASIRLGTSFFKFRRSIMFIPADQPFVEAHTIDTLNNLYKSFGVNKILSCHASGRRCSPVVFGRKYFKELSELKGDVGGRDVIFRHPDNLVIHELAGEFEPLDVDTQEELKVLIDRRAFPDIQNS